MTTKHGTFGNLHGNYLEAKVGPGDIDHRATEPLCQVYNARHLDHACFHQSVKPPHLAIACLIENEMLLPENQGSKDLCERAPLNRE